MHPSPQPVSARSTRSVSLSPQKAFFPPASFRRGPRSCIRPLRPAAVALALLGGAFLAAPLPAQTAAPATQKPDGKVVELSPFLVSTDQDNGYQAASTVAGSRLATALKETPAMIGVLTKEFIDDIGALNISEAASWGANVYMDGAENNAVNLNFLPNAVIRGVPGSSWSIARNYFVAYVPVDSTTIERVEIPRGPNAALYGDAPLGGLINSNSKRAKLKRQFANFTFRTDNLGSLRGAIDVNAFAGEKLAVRVNGMEEQRYGWQDGDLQKNRTMLLSGTYALTRNTTFRGEIEFDSNARTVPAQNFSEQVANWDRTTVFTGPRTANPAASTGTTTMALNDYWIYDSGSPGLGLLNWKGFGRTTGTGFAVIPDADSAWATPGKPNYPILPRREFSMSPTHSPIAEKDTWLFAGYLEHTFFDKLAVELAYQYVHPTVDKFSGTPFNGYAIDVNTVRPDGAANPHFGEVFADLEWARSRVQNFTYDTRILVAYPFKWRFMEQRLVGMAGYHRDHFQQLLSRLTRLNGTSNVVQNANNLIRVRRYASDGNIDLGEPESSNGVDIGYRLFTNNQSMSQVTYYQFALVGRYWDGKVSTNFGLRHDDVKQDSNTQSPGAGSVTINTPPSYIWNSTDPVRKGTATTTDDYPQRFQKDSLTAGAVYFPLKWLGVFANHSQGFNVVGSGQHLSFEPWAPPQNDGYDFGLKVELFDGKISGTVSRYISHKDGVEGSGGQASLSNNFKTLWGYTRDSYLALANAATAAGNPAEATRLTGLANTADAASALVAPGAFDSRTLRATGWEVDLTANLTKNWRAIFNFALPESKLSNAYPEAKAYYAANITEWRAQLNNPNANLTGINSTINTLDTAFINSSDGRTPTGTPDYTANVYATYRFAAGRLKGVRLGGGVQFQGRRVIGVPLSFNAATGAFVIPDPLATIKSDQTQIANAMVAYDFKLWKRPLSLQLNITNLFDEDKIVYTGYNTYTYTPAGGSLTGAQVPSSYRYLPPRTASLTLTARF